MIKSLRRQQCGIDIAISILPIIFVVIFAFTVAGCKKAEKESLPAMAKRPIPLPTEEDAYFIDVTQHTGIDFVHSFGDGKLSNIIETVGSGAAFLDYDQDGFLDLYVANGAFIESVSDGEKPRAAYKNRLYRNLAGAAFEDVTGRAGVGNKQRYGMGVAVADYDNDGYPDIYVCNYGRNVLYHNDANGAFSDVTARAGVGGDLCSVGAVWFDYDNDGLLDLYVGNYLDYDPGYAYYYAPDGFPGPLAYTGQPDVLYRNNGDGAFEDITEKMGLHRPEGRMMGIGAADLNDDGFVDIYIANDAMANYLYYNENGQRFREMAIGAGVAFSEGGEETSSMAVDFADYNGDGRMDIFVSDIHFCALYRNEGNEIFTDVTIPAGIAAPSGQYDGWGASFIDYDNDGDVDIFKTNGDLNHLFGQEDQLFENVGGGKYKDVSVERGKYFLREQVGRGACFGDYDNDGDIDIFIINLEDRAVLLRNQGLDQNNWLKIQLIGTTSNRDGIGAKVKIVTNGKAQIAQKKSSSGYLSTNDPRIHFGLGKNEVVERIEITWPSGKSQLVENVRAGQILTVREQ